MAKKKIGQILIDMSVVSQTEVEQALAQQQSGGSKKLGEILIDLKACDEESVAKALAAQSGSKYCQISKFKIPPEVVAAVPKDVAIEYTIMPLKLKGKRDLIVACETSLDPAVDPKNYLIIEELEFRLNGMRLDSVVASKAEIIAAINQYYGETLGLEEAMEGLEDEIDVRGMATRPAAPTRTTATTRRSCA